MDRDIEREDEEATPAEGVPLRARLKVVAHYALLASPVLALLALVLAITALILGRTASPPDDSKARIETLSATLAETKNELESLKFAMARERSARVDEHRQTEERDELVVQHVTRLQTKLKVTPTLEDQLKAPAHSAPVAVSAPVAAPTVVQPAPAAVVEKNAAATPAVPAKPAAEQPKPAAAPAKPTAAPPAPAKKPSPAPAKQSPQVSTLKEAIEQMNAASAKKH
jgi:hypothetical protein